MGCRTDQKMLEIAWDLWDYRNGFVHEAAREFGHQHIAARIRAEYERGPSRLRDVDKPLLRIPMTKLLKSPLKVQEAWLASIVAARDRGQRRDQETLGRERRLLREWLTGLETR